jgi:hypothetical protein
MARIRTPENQDLHALQVGRLDASRGLRIAAVTGESSASEPLSEGVYLLSSTVPVFISAGPVAVAGDIAGSLLLGPGAVFPLYMEDGDQLAVRAVDQDGALLAVPFFAA